MPFEVPLSAVSYIRIDSIITIHDAADVQKQDSGVKFPAEISESHQENNLPQRDYKDHLSKKDKRKRLRMCACEMIKLNTIYDKTVKTDRKIDDKRTEKIVKSDSSADEEKCNCKMLARCDVGQEAHTSNYFDTNKRIATPWTKTNSDNNSDSGSEVDCECAKAVSALSCKTESVKLEDLTYVHSNVNCSCEFCTYFDDEDDNSNDYTIKPYQTCKGRSLNKYFSAFYSAMAKGLDNKFLCPEVKKELTGVIQKSHDSLKKRFNEIENSECECQSDALDSYGLSKTSTKKRLMDDFNPQKEIRASGSEVSKNSDNSMVVDCECEVEYKKMKKVIRTKNEKLEQRTEGKTSTKKRLIDDCNLQQEIRASGSEVSKNSDNSVDCECRVEFKKIKKVTRTKNEKLEQRTEGKTSTKKRLIDDCNLQQEIRASGSEVSKNSDNSVDCECEVEFKKMKKVTRTKNEKLEQRTEGKTSTKKRLMDDGNLQQEIRANGSEVSKNSDNSVDCECRVEFKKDVDCECKVEFKKIKKVTRTKNAKLEQRTEGLRMWNERPLTVEADCCSDCEPKSSTNFNKNSVSSRLTTSKVDNQKVSRLTTPAVKDSETECSCEKLQRLQKNCAQKGLVLLPAELSNMVLRDTGRNEKKLYKKFIVIFQRKTRDNPEVRNPDQFRK